MSAAHHKILAMALYWEIRVHDRFDFEKFLGQFDESFGLYVFESVERHLGAHGSDLAGTKWSKALGGGLFEFRLASDGKSASGGGLVRIFYCFEPGRVVLLLSAYDKKRASSKTKQNLEIRRARSRM